MKVKNFVILGLVIIILTGNGCVSAETRDSNLKFEENVSLNTKKIIISNNTRGQMYIYACACTCKHGPCLHPNDFVMISMGKGKTPSPVEQGKLFTYQSNVDCKVQLIVLIKESLTGRVIDISKETFWLNLNSWDVATWMFVEGFERRGHIRNYLEFKDENLDKGEGEEK